MLNSLKFYRKQVNLGLLYISLSNGIKVIEVCMQTNIYYLKLRPNSVIQFAIIIVKPFTENYLWLY